MADYSYLTNTANFKPFSMQEMLTPFLMYKDEYEKAENSTEELSKADEFKYLDETLPEESKARKRYDNFSKDLRSAAEDLAHNGLTMQNRGTISSLRKRYIGEIGSLTKASAAFEEEKKLRRTLGAQDPSMMYAKDIANLTIDDYLDGKTPNMYSISGNDLYAKAANATKAISSRIFSTEEGRKILSNYYIDYVQKRGFTQEDMDNFYNDASKIPALKNALDDILDATGASENLHGAEKRRAYKYALRGIMDGAIYEEQHSPQRDLGKIDAATQAQLDLQEKNFNFSVSQLDLQAAKAGYRVNNQGKLEIDPKRVQVLKDLKQKGKNSSSSEYGTQLSKAIKLSWHGDNDKDTNGEADDDVTTSVLSDTDDLPGRPYDYNDLPTYVKNKVNTIVGDGNVDYYTYYFQPFEAGFFNDTEAELTILPRKTGIKQKSEDLDFGGL